MKIDTSSVKFEEFASVVRLSGSKRFSRLKNIFAKRDICINLKAKCEQNFKKTFSSFSFFAEKFSIKAGEIQKEIFLFVYKEPENRWEEHEEVNPREGEIE